MAADQVWEMIAGGARLADILETLCSTIGAQAFHYDFADGKRSRWILANRRGKLIRT
jgi:hypothetical protein